MCHVSPCVNRRYTNRNRIKLGKIKCCKLVQFMYDTYLDMLYVLYLDVLEAIQLKEPNRQLLQGVRGQI